MNQHRISMHHWALLMLYSLLWLIFLPFLLTIKRLTPVDNGRLGFGMPKGPYKIWIQAASLGEAKLAVNLVQELNSRGVTSILVTTNTRQGMELLEKKLGPNTGKAYFPFDIVCFMGLALLRVKPSCLVLLETEIWPSLLYVCRKNKIPVVLGNGRMSLKSFCRYYFLRKLLAGIGPGEIAAVSRKDRERFSAVFPYAETALMPNIKFDLLAQAEPIAYVQNPLSSYFKPKHPLIVLGSIRKEEEPLIFNVIQRIHINRPKTTVALFPRHLTRIDKWKDLLQKNYIPWILRSDMQTGTAPSGVIIWDKFGELEPAYALARSAFVGGSLMPCGGQNFLEALAQGLIPCVGPFRDNFHWVGNEILDAGLLIEVKDEQELYQKLILSQTGSRENVEKKFREYLQDRLGGTAMLAERAVRNLR